MSIKPQLPGTFPAILSAATRQLIDALAIAFPDITIAVTWLPKARRVCVLISADGLFLPYDPNFGSYTPGAWRASKIQNRFVFENQVREIVETRLDGSGFVTRQGHRFLRVYLFNADTTASGPAVDKKGRVGSKRTLLPIEASAWEIWRASLDEIT